MEVVYMILILYNIDVRENNFIAVVVSGVQCKCGDYYRPEFYGLTNDGKSYRGLIGDFANPTVYHWEQIDGCYQNIAKTIVSNLDIVDGTTFNLPLSTYYSPGISINNERITVHGNDYDSNDIIGAYTTLSRNGWILSIVTHIDGIVEVRDINYPNSKTTITRYNVDRSVRLMAINNRPYLRINDRQVVALTDDRDMMDIPM